MPKPLFIVGTGRSGTTLLRALLNAHPDLHLSLESSFMVVVRAAKYARSPKNELDRYFRSVPFGWLQLDRDALLEKISPNTSCGDVFRSLMQMDSARYGKSYWGDKTPAHWIAVERLRQAFPEAVIVHLVRDPRHVVGSLLRMPWGSPSLIMNAIYVELTLGALKKRTDVHHIRFEDLIAEPEKTLRFILKQIDLPWSDQLLQHEKHSPNDVVGLPWLTRAYTELAPCNSKSGLSTKKEPWVELICRSAFKHYGYERYNLPLSMASLVRDICAMGSSVLHMLRTVVAPHKDPEKELQRWLCHNRKAFQLYPGWDADRVVQASLGTKKEVP